MSKHLSPGTKPLEYAPFYWGHLLCTQSRRRLTMLRVLIFTTEYILFKTCSIIMQRNSLV